MRARWIGRIRQAALALLFVGVGLLLESIAGLESTWIWAALVVVCAAVAIEWEKIPWRRLWRWRGANLVKTMLMLGLVGGIGYDLTLKDSSRSESGWTHSTLSDAEQVRARAECRMKAFEAIPDVHYALTKSGEREVYRASCLVSKGFVREGGR